MSLWGRRYVCVCARVVNCLHSLCTNMRKCDVRLKMASGDSAAEVLHMWASALFPYPSAFSTSTQPMLLSPR